MSDSDDSDTDGELEMPPLTVMPEGLVEIFRSFMLREDYTGALEFATESYGFIPTPFVINEILFKIMMNCDEDLAYHAQDYLEGALRTMPHHDEQMYNIKEALTRPSASNKDAWDVFSHFVWSSLYHLLSHKIPEAFHDHREYVKNPNCEMLVEIYVKAFLKCPIKSVILGSRLDVRLSSLLKWINLFYKFDIQKEPVLENLHKLLDYIVDSEISSDPSLPLCVKIHTANLSQYILHILNVCKDVFSTLERQQRFFNNSSSPYLITKVCQYRLHELIEKKDLPRNPGMLTLKSIADNYFFRHPKEDPESSKQTSLNLSSKSNFPQKSGLGKKLKKFSKDPVPGDAVFHVCCRLGKPADLLQALYKDKSKDINIKNSIGNTPLHEACLASSFLCAKFLIEEAGDRKVDYRATDNEGRTPLHCAVNVDGFDIVKLILNRGGKDLVKCQDNKGKRPIDYCTSDDMKKILQKAESELKEQQKDEPGRSLDSTEPKLPNLRKCEDFHLFLRTLRTLVSNYCEIYDLPKDESDAIFSSIPVLSHDDKECYHYKAENHTLCLEDSSTLDSFCDIIKKFISCAKNDAKEKRAEGELSHWNSFVGAFK